MVGEQLRSWRERRHVSQLDLSLQAGISARHLSFVETGRSKPSSGLILRLSEELDVPLRERNVLLLAGGFAPAYPERGLDAPPLSAVTSSMTLWMNFIFSSTATGKILMACCSEKASDKAPTISGERASPSR